MIRTERDPAWWQGIANHPEVAPHVFGGCAPVALGPVVENPSALPLRSEHGGIIFSPLDPLGTVMEMHTLYTPEGWGREVAQAAKPMMALAFTRALVVVTYEQAGHFRSRPPKTHGWRLHGEPKDLGLSRPLIGWALMKDQWEASPAGRRLSCLQSSPQS